MVGLRFIYQLSSAFKSQEFEFWCKGSRVRIITKFDEMTNESAMTTGHVEQIFCDSLMPTCSKNIVHQFNNLSLPDRDEHKITPVSVFY